MEILVHWHHRCCERLQKPAWLNYPIRLTYRFWGPRHHQPLVPFPVPGWNLVHQRQLINPTYLYYCSVLSSLGAVP